MGGSGYRTVADRMGPPGIEEPGSYTTSGGRVEELQAFVPMAAAARGGAALQHLTRARRDQSSGF